MADIGKDPVIRVHMNYPVRVAMNGVVAAIPLVLAYPAAKNLLEGEAWNKGVHMYDYQNFGIEEYAIGGLVSIAAFILLRYANFSFDAGKAHIVSTKPVTRDGRVKDPIL